MTNQWIELESQVYMNVARRTPIVLTTAEPDDSELLQAATSLGVAAVVKKPWTPQLLRQAVQQLLDPPTG